MARISNILRSLGFLVATAGVSFACSQTGDVQTAAVIGAMGGFVGGAAGNFLYEFLKESYLGLTQSVARRWYRGSGKIDPNNDVATALRLAQIDALESITKRFDMSWPSQPDPEQRAACHRFSSGLRSFLSAEKQTAVRGLEVGFDASLTQQEAELSGRIIDALPASLESGLSLQQLQTLNAAPNLAGEARQSIDARFQAVRRSVENLVLDELLDGARRYNQDLQGPPIDEIPPLFLNAFGPNEPASDSWFGLFLRGAAHAIKTDDKAARIWEAEQLALISDILLETNQGQEIVKVRLGEIKTVIDQLLGALAIDLAAARGDILFVRKAMEAQAVRLRDDAIPFDRATSISVEGTLRFSPLNPRIPFVGRTNELSAIAGFCRSPEPFRWWVVAGGGGAGKTRLARHACLLLGAQGWEAGFLRRDFEADPGAVAAWTPSAPTLIVVDYPLARVTEVRKLCLALIARAPSLQVPVRVLLLEREGGADFRQRFEGTDQTERGKIALNRYSTEPLLVPALSEDELWSMVRDCPWNDAGRRVSMAPTTFFERLNQIDPFRRVLVAMILAEASAAADRPSFDTLEEELRELLRRDRDHLWPAELGVKGKNIGTAEADEVIAFASMVDGLSIERLAEVDKARGRPFDRTLLKPACQAAGRGDTRKAVVPRLEPDLFGEFFALEALSASPHDEFADPNPHPWMPDSAWRYDGDKMRDFASRALQNFTEHRALKRVVVGVPGIWQSWDLVARLMRFGAQYAIDGIIDAANFLGRNVDADVGAARALARLALEIGADEKLPHLDLLPPIMKALRTTLDKHDENGLREEWARSATNFVGRVAKKDSEACLALLDDLRGFADAHSDQAALREQWAQSVTNFINRVAERDAATCAALLSDLRGVADAHPEHIALRRLWAESVTNFINGAAAREAATCSALMRDLRALADEYREEAALHEEWAKSVTNFIDGIATTDATTCLILLGELFALADERRDEVRLREEWAKSIANFVGRVATTDAVGCTTLLDDLRAFSDAHPHEPVLRELWATGVKNFVFNVATSDAAACLALLGELRAFGDAHPGEEALREQWANSVFDFVTDVATTDAPTCLAMLGDLRAFADAHPGEPALREAWANSVINFIGAVATTEVATCHALLGEMRALADARPGDAALREAWGKGATNFVGRFAATDAAACLVPLRDLRVFADAHRDEAALRKQWGNSVRNFIIGVAATDAATCLGLLDELHAFADAHPDDAELRDMWARSTAPLAEAIAKADRSEFGKLINALEHDIARAIARFEGNQTIVQAWATCARAIFNVAPEDERSGVDEAFQLRFAAMQTARLKASIGVVTSITSLTQDEVLQRLGLNKTGDESSPKARGGGT